MKDGAEDIEDIAEEPDDDKGEGEAIGGGAAEVFDYLRGKDYDPAGNRYGSGGCQGSCCVLQHCVREELPANTAQCFEPHGHVSDICLPFCEATCTRVRCCKEDIVESELGVNMAFT